MVLGTDGNFYGVTYSGGAWGGGTFYKITSNGTFTVVYSFGEYSNDPSSPVTPLVQARDDNFYGVTSFGGTNNDGTVFKLTQKGVFTTVYEFSGTDGYDPIGPLVQATDGNLYGVTGGSTNGQGTLFKLSPSATVTTLHNFTGPDGALPVALLQNTNGRFYGLTSQGGTSGKGTVFSLDTGLGPFVSFVPPLSSGKVGNIIQIIGQGFTSSTNVTFHGAAPAIPAFVSVSGTYLKVAVPNGALTGPATVTTSSGTLTSNKTFRVTPQITSFNPISGSVGTQVTITGVSLRQTTKVTFGGVAATTVTVNSDKQVRATVPSGAKTGHIAITTAGGTITSSGTFTVM